MDDRTPWQRAGLRWLREPLVHFFALGALLFAVHALVVSDPRTIVVTPGLRADLARRFEDDHGRKPQPAELRAAIEAWGRNEALFREALRRGLDQDDPNIRDVLIGKMQGAAELEVPARQATEAELQSWLTDHRELYERPLRYHFEAIAFPKVEADASAERDLFARRLAEGAAPATLGRPVSGGKLTAVDLPHRMATELAEQIPKLSPGTWQGVDGAKDLWLVRVKEVSGGLPSLEEMRPRLLADWTIAFRRAATERVVERTVRTYRFEERP